MIGCLGGSGLLDADGSIREKVEAYVGEHPGASFDEVEAACFPGRDGNLHLFALSPRHFECAMTRTCQVLVEGDYDGVLIPGVHFIEVKADYRNLAEVIEQVRDVDGCREMAERCHRDLVASEKHTYRRFAAGVVAHIGEQVPRPNSGGFLFRLAFVLHPLVEPLLIFVERHRMEVFWFAVRHGRHVVPKRFRPWFRRRLLPKSYR
jgi:hypothetical protein